MAKTKMRPSKDGSGLSISTEDALVRAAVKLFSSKGYDGTSIQDLASEAGVARGALYLYFSAKDDVLRHIHERFLDRLLDQTDAILAEPGSAADHLSRLISEMVSMAGDHREELAIFVQERRRLDSETFSGVLAKSDAFVDKLVGLLDRGCADGTFRDIRSTKLLAFGLMGMCSWAYQWYRPGPSGLAEIGDGYAAIVLQGLRQGRRTPVGRSEPKPLHQQDDASTKNKLLNAAVVTFGTAGYHHTTIDQLAERAGLTKGAFYSNFANKEEVLREIYLRFMDQLLADTEDMVRPDEMIAKQLAALVTEMVAIVGDRRDQLAIFVQERPYLSVDSSTAVTVRDDAFISRLAGLLDRGASSAELRTGLPGKLIAFGIIGMCTWTYQWYRPGAMALPDTGQLYADVLLNGLQATTR